MELKRRYREIDRSPTCGAVVVKEKGGSSKAMRTVKSPRPVQFQLQLERMKVGIKKSGWRMIRDTYECNGVSWD